MGTFDSHFHLIDPRFPLVANNGFLPNPFTATDYQTETATLGITGGAVVSGSFQGFDTGYLLDALALLGPKFVGVANVHSTVSDGELMRLEDANIRAVRFNLYRGTSEPMADLVTVAQRAWDIAGMHTELYVDAADLADLEPLLCRMPRISIDHLGMSDAHQDVLLRLVERGARVKMTGFGRVDLDIPSKLQAINAVNPAALMFGTDLPSTRARRRFGLTDIALITNTLGANSAEAVLDDNAAAFYRITGG